MLSGPQEASLQIRLVEMMEFKLGHFRSQEMMLLKCCIQYASSGHRTGKGQFSFQSQRKAMPKNVQTTAQLHSFHILVKYAQNSASQASILRELSTARCTSQIQKRQRNQRSNCKHFFWIMEKLEFQKNIFFYFINHTKSFDCVDHNKLWKAPKEMGIPDHHTCL